MIKDLTPDHQLMIWRPDIGLRQLPEQPRRGVDDKIILGATLRNCRRVVIVVAVLYVWSEFVSFASGAEVYRGRVVDEETGMPLVGAVITVVWFRSPLIYMERSREFQSAQEAIADANGNFLLSVAPGIDWNVFTYVLDKPEIVIFQPGYEPTWVGWRVRMALTEEQFSEALTHGLIVKLRRLNTKGEMEKYAEIMTPPRVPKDAVPQHVKAVNLQHARLGWPLYEVKEQGK